MRKSNGNRGKVIGAERSENLNSALRALSAEALREFIVDVLHRLEVGPRGELEDALLRRAAAGAEGWRPAAPSCAIVEEVKSFAAAARRIGSAEPSEVDDYLRQGITASLAGEHEVAREVFEALLTPLCNADIYVGQDEMVDEVLQVDLHDCGTRYAAAVYVTTPLSDRAGAVVAAIERVRDLSYFNDPLAALGSILGEPLPQLDTFLPDWIAHLERCANHLSESESEPEKWLRAAIGRRDGIAGLERLARSTKRPQAVRDWCDAVRATGDWVMTLSACETGAALVTSTPWRGDLLDRAALAAQALGRLDTPKKLEAAWLRAPSLARLLRWLLAETPKSPTIRKRVASALKACPTKAPRLVGFLHVLIGDIESSAKLLEQAPGLGWSNNGHPGHLLFPAFAWMLGGRPKGSVREGLSQVLERPLQSERDYGNARLDDFGAEGDAEPKLHTPSLIDVLRAAEVVERLTGPDRAVALAAMKAAATKRTDGVLSEKRRRHYNHAASLVACCVELEVVVGNAGGKDSPWAEALCARTCRFPAFQAELRSALGQARTAVVVVASASAAR